MAEKKEVTTTCWCLMEAMIMGENFALTSEAIKRKAWTIADWYAYWLTSMLEKLKTDCGWDTDESVKLLKEAMDLLPEKKFDDALAKIIEAKFGMSKVLGECKVG